MALPSSRNTTYGPKPEQLLSADLNAIQDAIKSVWDGSHGTYKRFYGPFDFHIDQPTGTDAAPSDAIVRHSASSPVFASLRNYTGETIDRVTFFVDPLSTTGVIVEYREDDFALGTTPVATTLVSSSTGFQQLVINPAATLASSRIPHIRFAYNAGTGGWLYGALVEYSA